eukprot:2842418-Pleurochrysis_carterae.AAC.1
MAALVAAAAAQAAAASGTNCGTICGTICGGGSKGSSDGGGGCSLECQWELGQQRSLWSKRKHTVQRVAEAAVEGLKTRYSSEGPGKDLKGIASTAAAKKAAAAAKPAAAKISAPPPTDADKPAAGNPSAAAGKKQPTKKAKGLWHEVPQGHALKVGNNIEAKLFAKKLTPPGCKLYHNRFFAGQIAAVHEEGDLFYILYRDHAFE